MASGLCGHITESQCIYPVQHDLCDRIGPLCVHNSSNNKIVGSFEVNQFHCVFRTNNNIKRTTKSRLLRYGLLALYAFFLVKLAGDVCKPNRVVRLPYVTKYNNEINVLYNTLFSREENFAKSKFEIFSREDIFANILFTRKYLPAKVITLCATVVGETGVGWDTFHFFSNIAENI